MEESRNETQNISMEEDKEGVDCVFEKQERWHYDYGYEVFTKIDFNIEPAPTLPEVKPKHAIKFSFSSKLRSFSIFFYIYMHTGYAHQLEQNAYSHRQNFRDNTLWTKLLCSILVFRGCSF